MRATRFGANVFDPSWVAEDFFYAEGGPRAYPDHHCKLTYAISRPFLLGRRNAVDVGCRDGEYTRYLQQDFEHVYCFDARMRKRFARNVDTDRTTHFACALSDEPGEIVMFGGTHDPRHKANAATMRAFPLDSFNLQDVDYLKIDVEGFERKVLAGAAETIARCRPLIVIEQNEVHLPGEAAGAARAWLEERGYRHVATCSRGWDHVMRPE